MQGSRQYQVLGYPNKHKHELDSSSMTCLSRAHRARDGFRPQTKQPVPGEAFTRRTLRSQQCPSPVATGWCSGPHLRAPGAASRALVPSDALWRVRKLMLAFT